MKSRLHIVAAAVAAIASTTAFAAPALAQTGDALLNSLFSELEASFVANGQRLTRVADLRNSIEDGGNRGDIVRLDGGRSYWVIGVCDEDCSDFDVIVRDTNGNTVGSDTLTDDSPVVQLSGVRGGGYQISSVMADCAVNPCKTAVRIYRID